MNTINTQKLVKWLSLALMLMLVIGQLGRVQLTHTLAVYPQDLVALGLSLVILIKLGFVGWLSGLSGLWVWQLAFVVWLVVSWLLTYLLGKPYLPESGLYLIRLLVLVSPGFLLYLWRIRYRASSSLSVAYFLRIFGLLGVFVGLIQYTLLPDMRFAYQWGFDDHLNRLVGLYLDPGFTGVMFVLVLILWLKQKPSLLVYLIQASILIAVILTYSRASMVALAVLLIARLLRLPSWSSLQLPVLSLLVLLMLPAQAGEGIKLSRSYSVGTRIESSITSLDILRQSPIIGIGYNNYRAYVAPVGDMPNHVSAPDNSYVGIMLFGGLIGLALFICYLAAALKYGYAHDEYVFYSFLVLSVHALFNNTWFYPFTLLWISLLLGWRYKFTH